MQAKSIQIFMIIDCLKKVFIVFVPSVILTDSVFKMGKNMKNYYPQVFSEE